MKFHYFSPAPNFYVGASKREPTLVPLPTHLLV